MAGQTPKQTPKTKKDRREAARSKRAEAQRARQRAARRKRMMMFGFLGLVVAIIAGVVINNARKDDLAAAAAEKAGCTELRTITELSASPHLDENAPAPEYNSNPPTSGLHFGRTAPWGTSQQNIDDKLLVHNLEHGGVIVHYRPDDIGETELEPVEEYVDTLDVGSDEAGIILQPNPRIAQPVAIASWGHLQTCKELDLEVVKQYVRKECGKGPEPFACTPGAKS